MRPTYSPRDYGSYYVEPAKPAADDKPAATELRATDCKTPEDWARWARERVEYEDGYGYERGRY